MNTGIKQGTFQIAAVLLQVIPAQAGNNVRRSQSQVKVRELLRDSRLRGMTGRNDLKYTRKISDV